MCVTMNQLRVPFWAWSSKGNAQNFYFHFYFYFYFYFHHIVILILILRALTSKMCLIHTSLACPDCQENFRIFLTQYLMCTNTGALGGLVVKWFLQNDLLWLIPLVWWQTLLSRLFPQPSSFNAQNKDFWGDWLEIIQPRPRRSCLCIS